MYPSLKTTDTVSISRLGTKVPFPAFWSTLLMTLPDEMDIESTINQLNTLFPVIEYAHRNSIYLKTSVPNDSLITIYQSSLISSPSFRRAHINVDSAWNITTGKKYIKAGVYDDPIYWKHPDFGGPNFRKSVIKGGRDFVHQLDISVLDSINGNHGTSVAGIIGALRNNRIGIAGY